MKSLLLALFLVLPISVSGQTGASRLYNESVFEPGADPLHALPITREEDFKIRVLRVVRPEAFLFDGLSAGLNEIKNDPGAWTRGPDGFAKRFGSEAGRSGVREMLGFGLDTALHTDPRLYRSTHTGFRRRLFDALSQVVVTRTESGGHAPAIANVGSAFAAGQIQTIWMPANDAHFRDGLVDAGVMLMGDAARDVAREFWPDIRRKLKHQD
jgi:hypothetical protein